MKINSHQLKNFTLHGFDNDYIFSTIKNTDNFYEIEVLDSWNQYFDDVQLILDVGANIGNHSIYWSQLNNVNKIIAFEPIKKNFKLLKKNITHNNISKVEIHQLALGKKDGFALIDKEDSNNLGATSLRFVEDETDIKIMPGDVFLSDKNYSVDLVKIDVEGFEIDVLKGLKQTIYQYKPILWVEINLDNLKEVLSLINKQGYFIVDIIKFNILAIHKTKIKNLKEISKDDLIFNMLKNLEASWMYRNSFLDSEKQKNEEKTRLEKLKKLSEKHLSQFLFEQKKCEDLIKRNNNLESNLNHEQKISEDLIKRNNNLESNLNHEQKISEDLIKRNNNLESNLNHEQKISEDLIKRNNNLESNLNHEQKISEDLIKRNNNLESNLNHEQKINVDLLERNEFFESSLLREQEKVEEFQELNEKRLSQFLYEQKKCEELKKQSGKNLSKYLYEQGKANSLKNQNEDLKNLVKAYQERKVVKVTDSILKVFRFTKRQEQVHSKKDSPNSSSKNNATSNHLKKFTDIEPGKSEFSCEVSKRELKELNDIKVAVILDEFSYNCFKYEFNAISVDPSNWLEIFETEKPDLFICESVWSGVDSELRPWKGQIYSSVNFKSENRGILLDILKYCNGNGITSIFWNKEDPTHYDDDIHNFVDTALKFDHIFTTAEECVQKYKDEYGHQSVHLLMFGAQPQLFNPIEEQERSEDIIFAGSWYNTHVQRCNEMKEIFDNILDSGYNLKIYDRAYHTHKDDQNRIFPDKYVEFINPPLPFDQVKTVYKESKYALNINTVTDSNTMFARRVFELMLCNSLVLSNYSKGMKKIFGDNVVFIGNNTINLSNSEKKRIDNLYNVLKNHTYSNRFKQILNSINYEYVPENNTVTLYYVVNDKFEIKNILEHYESVYYNSKKLVLLLSDQIPNHLIKNIYQKYTNEEVSVYSLNYLLNQNGIISNDTPYFIFATLQLKTDFIEKAILHYSYIESDVGITLGDKFTFKKEAENVKNVLFSNKNFTKAFKNSFQDDFIEFSIYNIQI
nr:FkbM family methyltransferase [uncultured Methanobacterium sp.]